MSEQPDRPPYLPGWAPEDARAAVADVAAYADTLTDSELVGSLMCLNASITTSALRIGYAGPAISRRLRQHVAMGQLVARILFDRLTDTHPDTHDHCSGFFTAMAIAEAKVVSGSLGGRP